MSWFRTAVRQWVLLGWGSLILGSALAYAAPPLRPGDPTPPLQLTTGEGRPATLPALQGKVVLINFWASWCNPCLKELPLLERLHRELLEQGVIVLAINVDEEAGAGVGVVKHLGLTLPVAYDSRSQTIAQFGPDKLPSTYLLDRQGVVRSIHEGVIDEDDLRQIRTRLLTMP